ncbi:MAG: hypothetical protein GWP08_00460 [Nitrospiraceae bacterium]|nr:hypothetical protein [Nitrospiraceae bacterium]
MKHIRTMSKVKVSSAQMGTTEIITLIVSVLSALAAILTTVVPMFQEK